MSSPSLQRRALLSGTMLVAAVVGYGRRAYAACVNTGGTTYQCSGAETTTQTINANNATVSTLPGFSVNVAALGNNGITITGDGALSYTDANASPVTGALFALYVRSNGDYAGTSGSITIQANGALTGGVFGINHGTGTLSITANGDITGAGVHADNAASDGTDLHVTTGAGATVSGTYGIFARNKGHGATDVTTGGDVTASAGTGIGIYAPNLGTDLGVTIGAGTTVSGSTFGVNALNYGTGALTITANGDVTGTNNDGIFAKNSTAGGDLSVTTGADTTVSGGTRGIYADNFGGALTITANGDVTGTDNEGIRAFNRSGGTDLKVTTGAGTVSGGTFGILAKNYGTGSVTIITNGDVTGNSSAGILAYNSAAGSNLSVTTGAGTTVNGASSGISADNSGTGALTITANGDVTGTGVDGRGIFASNSATGTDLNVTTGSGTTVSGTSSGISARNYGTGALTITANGDVTGGTGDAIYAKSTAAPIDITVAAMSTVTSTAGFAIETVGGPAAVTVAGTVAGAMKIAGTLKFQPGATYKISVNPTAATHSTVTGTARLAGTVNASFATGHYVQKQYTILTAAGGLGGTTFSSLSTVDLPAGFFADLSYDADDVFLNLVLGLSTTGLNINQTNVANAINTFFNDGGALPPGFVTLAGLTGNALGNALSQLSGEAGAATTQVSFDATNQFMNLLLDPFNDGHFGTDGGDGGVLGYAAAPNDETSQAYAAVTPRDRRAVKAPAFAARWGVWASGYGGASKVSGDAATGSHDTTSRIYGMAAGADYHLSPDTVLGFALGGAGFNFGLSDGLGGGRADLFQAGLYGRHFIGHAYVAGALAYGWQDVTTDRTVTVSGTDKLEADFHPQTFAARLEGGYRFATPWLGVTPYSALQVTSFHLPAYAEHATSGSDQFALSYDSEVTTNWRTELGARLDKSFLLADGLLTLRSRLAWAHDSNTDRPAVATFQTLPGASFTVNGAAPAADGALVSAGVQMRWRNGFSLAGSFEGEFSGTTQSYAGKGTLRYAW